MQYLRAFLVFLFFIPSSVGFAQQASKVKLLCNWNDTALAPLNTKGHRYNEVWGFTVKGKEYAVIGSTIGAHIIDVTTCKQVVYAPARAQSASHRDYKTFKNYLYAGSEDGQSTLQIYDISYLPDSIHLVYESSPDSISRMHKIFIDTATAKLYLPTFKNNKGANDFMRVYSLQKPDSPSLLSIYNENGEVHDVYVKNDTAYCSSSFAGYYVIDFTNAPAFRRIGALTTYPYKGFNHSSWIGSDGIGVMADETYGLPLKVIDTRRMSRLTTLSTFSPRGLDTTSVPHNPFILGKFAFISYYQDGLQIYNLTDPVNPVQAGYYRTYAGGYYQGYNGAWGCYPFLPSRRILVSDMITGLYVLDADEATGTNKKNNFHIYPNPARDELHLIVPETMGGRLTYQVHDILGRMVASQQILLNDLANPPVSLPLPANWPGGMYVLRVSLGHQIFTAPFIKY